MEKCSSESQLICINCETKTDKLYHEYRQNTFGGDGIIKIPHCETCGKVVDKYVEYDLVIISLDALLLKRQAFRHILKNSGIKAYWKFCLVLLICEAFTKLLKQSSGLAKKKWTSDYVIYSALEVDIYYNFFLAFIERIVFLGGATFCMLLWKHYIQKADTWPSVRDYMNGLMLSSMGKVLMLPTILWGQDYNTGYTWLSNAFTTAANIQAARVLCPDWKGWTLTVCIVAAHLVEYRVSVLLPEKFTDISDHIKF